MKPAALPKDPALDNTLALLREDYRFISNRCERLGSDVFRTRLMLREAICARGEEAAEFVYGSDHFTRAGAMPVTVLKLLQDRGNVQLLDGDAHCHRKRMFMSLMTPDAIAAMGMAMADEWRSRLIRCERDGQLVLFDEIREVLCRAACRWSGVPLSEHEVGARTHELSEMIESTGTIGPRNWRALLLRSRSEELPLSWPQQPEILGFA